MAIDPILVADVVLEAALAVQAETVRIEPRADGDYLLAISREGETLTSLPLEAALATHVIARLGYVCGVDPADRRAKTGRTRVRSFDTQRDVIVTIQPSTRPRAELVFVACSQQQEPSIGERIGHYRVVAPLGAGGMGNVYEVVHERLGRRHALKVLQSWVLERDRASIDRFLQEAQAAARIRSSHIVEIFDFGYLSDGRPYFVMELLAGDNLASLIAQGPIPPSVAVSIACQLARGLNAAHDRAVIHADVAPGNMIVTDGHVTLVDFGLAHLRHDATDDAPADEVSGTPSYLSPERVRGLPPDEGSDLYAAGIVLYEMLTGWPPFAGTPYEVGMAHLYTVAPPVTSPYGPLPARLVNAVARCLAKEPSDRFPSAQALLDELSAIEEVLS